MPGAGQLPGRCLDWVTTKRLAFPTLDASAVSRVAREGVTYLTKGSTKNMAAHLTRRMTAAFGLVLLLVACGGRGNRWKPVMKPPSTAS